MGNRSILSNHSVAAGQSLAGVILPKVSVLIAGVVKAMFMTKIKGVLVVLLVGLALGGMGVGLSTTPVAVAQEKTGDQALDGLWEDVENKGGRFRFEGSTIKYHPAGKSEEMWTCRYNLTLTPMTIDIFQKDGTTHGIFVVERGTLFIALANAGEERPTRIKRDDTTTLLVLKRVAKGDGEEKKPAPKAEDGKLEFDQVVWVQNKAPQVSVIYVLVPDAAKELPEASKLVLLYAPLALREAERLTGPDERKLPRFKGEFTIAFLIPNATDGKQALATGFSVEQLREYTSVPQEKALKMLGRHTWTFQRLPLVKSGP